MLSTYFIIIQLHPYGYVSYICIFSIAVNIYSSSNQKPDFSPIRSYDHILIMQDDVMNPSWYARIRRRIWYCFAYKNSTCHHAIVEMPGDGVICAKRRLRHIGIQNE